MKSHRPLCISLLVVDILRLAALLACISVMKDTLNATELGPLGSLSVALTACQALFPLMALFLTLDFEAHSAYCPLYTAGKAVSAVAFIAWLSGAIPAAFLTLSVGNAKALTLALLITLVTIWDLCSAVISGLTFKPRREGGL